MLLQLVFIDATKLERVLAVLSVRARAVLVLRQACSALYVSCACSGYSDVLFGMGCYLAVRVSCWVGRRCGVFIFVFDGVCVFFVVLCSFCFCFSPMMF